MATAPEAAAMAALTSVTSLTSADIDPHLLGQQQQQQHPEEQPSSNSSNLVRSDSNRISMRRNTVPLVRQDALRNGASASTAAAAAGSSSRAGRIHQQVCRYCLRLYDDRRNLKGACPEAPDRLRVCIERLTCLTLADGVSYHCCADSEGDYINPCQLLVGRGRSARQGDSEANSCGEDDNHGKVGHAADAGVNGNEADDYDEEDDENDGDARSSLLDRLKAWSCVCLLALFVPCLCCYPACSLAYRACQRLHLAGGRHDALWTAAADPRQQAGVRKDATRNTIAGIAAASPEAADDEGVNASVA